MGVSAAVSSPGDADAVFRALADPTRRALVERLADADASVTELADPLPMSLNAVSKHLKVLEDAGLVARERLGRTHRLRLRPEALAAAETWMRTQTRAWEARLDALARVLEEDAS
jgi:DNA-binding transcriptional ArsR family regulator